MRSRGFTLIELMVTLVVLAIVAVGVSSYIGFGARLYGDVAAREQTLGQSRFVAERLVRELRNGAPNSVRVHEQTGIISCLEYIPVAASGVYSRLPVAPASDTELHLQLYNWDNNLLGLPLIVYPTAPEHYYSATTHQVRLNATVLNAAEISSPASGATVKLQLNAPHSFAADSPEQRFYILATAISYCARDGEIRRLQGHNYSAGLPASGAGVLMAQQVKQAMFLVQQPVLNRNAVVNVFLQFGSDISSDMFFNYEVHLPNVP
jgi:MSHA biogenesis protein MshO